MSELKKSAFSAMKREAPEMLSDFAGKVLETSVESARPFVREKAVAPDPDALRPHERADMLPVSLARQFGAISMLPLRAQMASVEVMRAMHRGDMQAEVAAVRMHTIATKGAEDSWLAAKLDEVQGGGTPAWTQALEDYQVSTVSTLDL